MAAPRTGAWARPSSAGPPKRCGRAGSCWLVANRHLPYEAVLKTLFRRVTLKVEASGYKIYEARK